MRNMTKWRRTLHRCYKRRYADRKRKGICVLCASKPAEKPHVHCRPCLDYQSMMYHQRKRRA